MLVKLVNSHITEDYTVEYTTRAKKYTQSLTK